MLRVTVLERGRIVRGESDSPSDAAQGTSQERVLPRGLYDRLERSEVNEERDGKGSVIDWRRRHGVVGQWVGVIQVPGLQLEILPKTDDVAPEVGGGHVDATRRNLMTMLVWGGLGTVRSRGLADLSLKRGTIYDQLVDAFLDRALEELERGLDRQYASEEASLPMLRGKLVVKQQVTRNAAQRHRFYCRYDALSEATPVSIRLKQCCWILVQRPLPESVLTKARDILGILDEVPDLAFRRGEPDPVFNRQNERFEDVYAFACMVLEGQAADARRGRVETFTLLFDMDKVFERFIAATLRAKVIPQFDGSVLRLQGKGDRRALLRDQDAGRGVLHLEPDLLVEQGGKTLVLDTKWKRLDAATPARPTNDDLYQLYAYLHRYQCRHAYLLYPSVGAASRTFSALRGHDAEVSGTIGVRFVDVNRPLWTPGGRTELVRELASIVREGLETTESAPLEAAR